MAGTAVCSVLLLLVSADVDASELILALVGALTYLMYYLHQKKGRTGRMTGTSTTCPSGDDTKGTKGRSSRSLQDAFRQCSERSFQCIDKMTSNVCSSAS